MSAASFYVAFCFVLCKNAFTAWLCIFTERTLQWHWHQLVPSLSQHHYLVHWLSTSSKHTSWRPTQYLKMWKGIIFRHFACMLWLKACWPNLSIVIMIMKVKMIMVLLLIITFTAAVGRLYVCVQNMMLHIIWFSECAFFTAVSHVKVYNTPLALKVTVIKTGMHGQSSVRLYSWEGWQKNT